MVEFIRQHGELLIAAAAVLVLIGVIIALSKTGIMENSMSGILNSFVEKAKESAGF